jgi:hypothetical protein
MITGVTANPHPLTGLTANTTYDWYVRADCGGSTWTGPSTFSTPCESTTVPYFENFDGVTAPAFPSCMTIENTNGDAYEWETDNTTYHSSPNAARIYRNSSVTMNDWFFTRGLQLTGGTTYEVSFAYGAENYDERLEVDWGNAAASGSMSGTAIFFDMDFSGKWYSGDGTFTPVTTGTYYVGFHGFSEQDKYYLYVDDIKVIEVVAATSWSGATDNDWDTPGNWSNGLPATTTNVTIPTGLTNYPTLTAAAECNNLTIKSDASGDGSLIGADNLTINGTATVERYIPDGNAWHNIASPVDGATLAVLYSNSFNVYVEEYTESTDSWVYVTDTTTTFPFGKGFSYALASGNTHTVEFQGDLRTTDLNLNGTSTPPIEFTSAPDKGFNFVGNPYTSALQWGVGTWGLTNVNNQVWVWDHSAAGGGNYQDYVPGTGGSLTNGIIPMGQGFFVQANAGSPSVSIPMDAQVHSSQAYYSPSRENDPPHLIVTVNKEERQDEVWIAFREGATEGYLNGYDGRKLFGSEESPQLYTVEEGENLSIDALPPLELNKTRVVPLFFDAGETGEQTMVADLSGLEFTDVILEDLYLGTTQILNENPVYVFQSTYYQNPDRFRLHFTQIAAGIGDESVSGPRVYSIDDAIYIESSGKLADIVKDVEVIDMYGRTVLRTKAEASGLVRIPMSVNNAYFVVKLIADGRIYTSKVFIK